MFHENFYDDESNNYILDYPISLIVTSKPFSFFPFDKLQFPTLTMTSKAVGAHTLKVVFSF